MRFEKSVFKPPYMIQAEINEQLKDFDMRIDWLRIRESRIRRLLVYCTQSEKGER